MLPLSNWGCNGCLFCDQRRYPSLEKHNGNKNTIEHALGCILVSIALAVVQEISFLSNYHSARRCILVFSSFFVHAGWYSVSSR